MDNKYTSAALAFRNATNLTVFGTTVNESAGIGLFIHEVFGSTNISYSTFAFNSQLYINDASMNKNMDSGNTFVFFKECPVDHSPTHLFIDSCNFLHSFGDDFKSPGLYIRIETYACTTVHIILKNSTFRGNWNNQQDGGNIAILFLCYAGLGNTLIELHGNVIANGSAQNGGGLSVDIGNKDLPITFQKETNICSYTLVVNDSCFFDNRAQAQGGGLFISNSYKVVYGAAIEGQTYINNCTFSSNTVDVGGYGEAVFVDGFLNFLKQKVSSFELTFTDCIFENNHQTPNTYSNLSYFATGAVSVLEGQDGIKFCDCIFRENSNTALSVVRSNVIFKGQNIFSGNTGYDGGGISLCSRSYAYFMKETILTFENNAVTHSGGGIYVSSQCPGYRTGCFFQFVVNVTEMLDTKSVQVIMKNNSARYAGNDIYGGDVTGCYVYYHGYDAPNVFSKVFQVANITTNNLSPISSMPIQVCVCNSSSGVPICNNRFSKYNIHPGESMSVLVVAVGQGGGVVPGVVIASPKNSIRGNQYVQQILNECKNLTYTLYFNGNVDQNLTLEIQKPDSYEDGSKYSSLVIQVHFKPCPLGFILKHSPKYCDCMDVLDSGIKCSFQEDMPVIERKQATTWIGGSDSYQWGMNLSQAVLFSSDCLQYTYCSSQMVRLKVNGTQLNEDDQCAGNHAGILCGSCNDGYSVSADFICTRCNELWMFVCIAMFFLTAPFMAITLICCCSSATNGTWNGFIFYVNVLQAKAVFFSLGIADFFILKLTISLMNLNFSILACLYKGSDAYMKVWLEYMFSFYILIVTAIVIIASDCNCYHCQSMVTKSFEVLDSCSSKKCSNTFTYDVCESHSNCYLWTFISCDLLRI